MKFKPLLLLSFSVILLISLPLFPQETASLSKDILIEADEVQKNVWSFGGNVLILGQVEESVVAFGGVVTVEGEVGELVFGFGSEIILKSTAVINGDLVALGGSVVKEPGCVVEGDTIYFETSKNLKNFFGKGLTGIPIFSPFLMAMKIIGVFIWLLLMLVVTGFLPKQVSFASEQIKKSFWPVTGVGLLGVIIFTGLILFSALLSIILIGIPILLALILVAIVLKIFGKVVLFYFFGEKIARILGIKKGTAFLFGILGFLLLSLIDFLPVFVSPLSFWLTVIFSVLTSLFSFCLSIIGWGVALRTRFGTTENWFVKKKA
ncbi:MAG: hypothetical protein JXB26_09440 [Candidatus Aminicenantes bacterium]|nr:hypothetical protein [Candidatus Aminicenantes bacterium]